MLCAKSLQLCPTLCDPMVCAHQALLLTRFSRQEYWSKLPCHPPGDLPDPEIKSRSLTLQVDSLLSEPPGKPHSKSCLSAFEQHAFEWQNLNLAQNPSCKRVKTCFFVSLSLSCPYNTGGRKERSGKGYYMSKDNLYPSAPQSPCKEQIMAEKMF